MNTKTLKEGGERGRRSYQARIETFRRLLMVLKPKVAVLSLTGDSNHKQFHLHFTAFVTLIQKKKVFTLNMWVTQRFL